MISVDIENIMRDPVHIKISSVSALCSSDVNSNFSKCNNTYLNGKVNI